MEPAGQQRDPRPTLLVIPIADSLLYVFELLYLQAQNGKISELKRVLVLASADRVAMAENLGSALIQMFGRETVTNVGRQTWQSSCVVWRTGCVGSTDTTAGPSVTGGEQDGSLQNASLQDLVIAANLHYTNAQNELRAGTGRVTARR